MDLLVDADRADDIHAAMARLGYGCLHRSADAGNYSRKDERVDFLYARRPIARKLLAGAREMKTYFGDLRVISTEGLIAFKLQGWVNDPRSTRDREDMRALLQANRGTVDMNEVREYFRLFDRMDCSMSSSEKSTDAPIAAAGGVTAPAAAPADPFQALDDLMVVVEELCPVWPSRPTFRNESNNRL